MALDHESIESYGVMSDVIERLLKSAPNQLVPSAAVPLGVAPSGADVIAKNAEMVTAMGALTGVRATAFVPVASLVSVVNASGAVNPDLPDPFNTIEVALTGVPYRIYGTKT